MRAFHYYRPVQQASFPSNICVCWSRNFLLLQQTQWTSLFPFMEPLLHLRRWSFRKLSIFLQVTFLRLIVTMFVSFGIIPFQALVWLRSSSPRDNVSDSFSVTPCDNRTGDITTSLFFPLRKSCHFLVTTYSRSWLSNRFFPTNSPTAKRRYLSHNMVNSPSAVLGQPMKINAPATLHRCLWSNGARNLALYRPQSASLKFLCTRISRGSMSVESSFRHLINTWVHEGLISHLN